LHLFPVSQFKDCSFLAMTSKMYYDSSQTAFRKSSETMLNSVQNADVCDATTVTSCYCCWSHHHIQFKELFNCCKVSLS
jgi:hypothetical protein